MRLWEFSKTGMPSCPRTGIAESPAAGVSHEAAAALMAEGCLFKRLGIGKPHILKAAQLAYCRGTTVEQELLASGILAGESYYEGLADHIGLQYIAEIDPRQLHMSEAIDTQLTRGPVVRINRRDQPALMAFSPTAGEAAELIRRLDQMPELAQRLCVASPRTIRKAIWEAGAPRRLRSAVNRLYDTMPAFSARVVLRGRQGIMFGAGATAAAFLAALYPAAFFPVLHVSCSSFYMMVLLLRGWALSAGFRQPAAPASPPQPGGPLPVYTVLVALYREAEMVPQLVAALNLIDWPKSLLDVKLVCEADDQATLTALQREALGGHFEIVMVPAAEPRTKPKALTYALSAARGEFLVIYDAEDRPHPGQLKEAFSRFRSGDGRLACLQSPLVMSNAGDSPIAAIFSLEYAALFRRLLPMMARLRMPMPLGGTSNHFRTATLKACGGWDPYNVTEDADLGLRLKRMGYDCGVLSLPTLEDAPTKWDVWLAQRSRWFKGWLQTLLVHFREPVRLYRQIGASGYLAVLLSTGGMLFSALIHPLIIYSIGHTLWLLIHFGPSTAGQFQVILFIVDGFNIVGSYALFAALGCEPMTSAERNRLGRPWINIPIYWMMLSLAAWRAVAEIRRSPFLWRKTPHEPFGACNAAVRKAPLRWPAAKNSTQERREPRRRPAASSPAG